jgi:DNA-binding beta-propeller fold protein YncE
MHGYGGIPEYATVAYSAMTGRRVGLARDAGGDFAVATSVGVSPDGTSVYVTGRSDLGPLTIAHNPALTHRLWDVTPSPGFQANALGVSPDGSRVFATGTSTKEGSPDYVTVGLDAHDGGQLWAAVYDGPTHGPDNAFALDVSPDGRRVFVTGGTGFSNDYATIAYGTR